MSEQEEKTEDVPEEQSTEQPGQDGTDGDVVPDPEDEDVAALAGAIEDWKQAKYYIHRLRQSLLGPDVDLRAFEQEFVDADDDIDAALIRLMKKLRADN